MKLLFSSSDKKFPDRSFKGGEDLNSNPEYPYWPEKGMWLSPAIETDTGVTSPWIEAQVKKTGKVSKRPKRIYTLYDETDLFHFRSLTDYTRAHGTFPLFMKEKEYLYTQYVDRSNHFSNKIAKWMDIYSTFSTWKNELNRKAGFSDTDLISSFIKEPLHFTDADDNIIKLRVSRDIDGSLNFQETALEAITGYVQSKKAYSRKDAMILLKQICDYIIRYIKKMSKCINPSPDDTIIGIDYNAMRSAGYKGIYIHESAVEEARAIKEGSPLYEIIEPLLYWSPETVCVWDYCFTD